MAYYSIGNNKILEAFAKKKIIFFIKKIKIGLAQSQWYTLTVSWSDDRTQS